MSEKLPTQPGTIDPTLVLGNTSVNPELKVKFTTFEQAQTAEKAYSDSFIDDYMEDKLKVGNEQVGIKGYLDKVEATDRDNAIIDNPEAIAGLYLSTTEMISRNLKILVAPGATAERRAVIKGAKDGFVSGLHDSAGEVADQIVDWSEGKAERFPNKAMRYHGLEIDGHDPLDAKDDSATDFRPNIKIQRQGGGTFIMGYSDKRVGEKMGNQEQGLSKRIYLNPNPEVAPQVFEQILQASNEAGLSLQLKIFQRAPEFAQAHLTRAKGQTMDALRGDGIVIYASEDQSNDVLNMVLSLAKDNPEALMGRETSKIPQSVAEGIAVGDEPTEVRGKSLTSHRVDMFSYAANYVEKSGKTGDEARELFKDRLAAIAEANHTDPNNIAFNKPSPNEKFATLSTEVAESQDYGHQQEVDMDEQEEQAELDVEVVNNVFESQVQQFIKSLNKRAETENRELNQEEVQQIKSLAQIVQQRRETISLEEQIEAEGGREGVDRASADGEVMRYMADNHIDIKAAEQRFEGEVGVFVRGLRERATREGRELSLEETRQIKLAVESVDDLRAFASRAA
jgi:hypothetical protein